MQTFKAGGLGVKRLHDGRLGSGPGRCQLSDGHGDEQADSRIEQENYLAGSQVRLNEKEGKAVKCEISRSRLECRAIDAYDGGLNFFIANAFYGDLANDKILMKIHKIGSPKPPKPPPALLACVCVLVFIFVFTSSQTLSVNLE